jgi:hypothetical protein
VDSDDAIVREQLDLIEMMEDAEEEKRVWEEIWPEARGRSDWMDVWCS